MIFRISSALFAKSAGTKIFHCLKRRNHTMLFTLHCLKCRFHGMMSSKERPNWEFRRLSLWVYKFVSFWIIRPIRFISVPPHWVSKKRGQPPYGDCPLALQDGLEPTTPWLTVMCSNQLSYWSRWSDNFVCHSLTVCKVKPLLRIIQTSEEKNRATSVKNGVGSILGHKLVSVNSCSEKKKY